MASNAASQPGDVKVSVEFLSELPFEFKTTKSFPKSQQEDFKNNWERIIADAIALDKEISRQVARVEWVFPRRDAKSPQFDPAIMELTQGETSSRTHQEVVLVVAPGLRKRGKSSGTDFDVENWLLPIEVSCEPLK
jgi:hypothetical protein